MKRRDARSLVADFDLWTAVTKTVDPLRPEPKPKPAEAPLPFPKSPAPIEMPARLRKAPGLPSYQAPVPAPAPRISGIEPNLRRKLERGRLSIDGTLDLHDMRQDEARTALHRFLIARAAQGARTILVITGKGSLAPHAPRGVLRTMLPIWLSQPGLSAIVSGYEQAARGHGGSGAFYVRLRQARTP